MEIRHIDSVECDGEDGNVYTVQIYQKFAITRDLSGERHEVPGMKTMSLTDGRRVNYTDADTFQIVQNDLILRKRG